MPRTSVPLSVAIALAGVLAAAALQPARAVGPDATAALDAAAKLPTPRVDGHPQLGGYWVDPKPFSFGNANSTVQTGSNIVVNLPPVDVVNGLDTQHAGARLANAKLRPQYKSAADEEKARQNFIHADYLDPAYQCASPGVARLGAPQEIVQTAQAVYLLYATQNRYRIIPTDGRTHDADAETMPDGDSVGHWEGDSLVIDTANISADTWVDHDGSFHSAGLHVTERLTRRGNTLTYQMHLEDPIFAVPFDAQPMVQTLGKAGQHLPEDYPCVEKSQAHMVTNDRH